MALVYRIRFDSLSLAWLEAVADLLCAIDDASEVMVEGPVRDAADRVRDVIFGAA